jgi:hypothetical protein
VKLNLDDDNVREVEVTRAEIRAFFEGKDFPDDLINSLDNAQGDAQNSLPQYVVIKIN